MWPFKSAFLSEPTLSMHYKNTGIKNEPVFAFQQAPGLFLYLENIVFSLAYIVSPGDRALLWECFYSKLVLVISNTLSC